MTTYNGEKYIQNQLSSIFNQTMKIDEVLIFDDVSDDDTVNIIENFIKDNKLTNWHLFINIKNVGWEKNFVNGISHASGDIIFLSDQDDIWIENKIEYMVKILEDNTDIGLLASNIKVKYEDRNQVRVKDALKKYGTNEIEKVHLNGKTFRPIRPGCSYAFRDKYVKLLKKYWFAGCPHDAMLWALALLNEELFIVNMPLIIQLRHEGTNTPICKKDVESRCNNLAFRSKLAQYLANKFAYIDDEKKEWLMKYSQIADTRIKAMRGHDPFALFCMIRWIKYYPKLISWGGDIAIVIKGK